MRKTLLSFKIITSAAAYEYDKEVTEYEMDCTGEKQFGYNVMHCYNNNVHGHEDITKAFAKSCNTFYSTIGERMGGAVLRQSAEDFAFNSELNFPLEHSKSSFVLDGNSTQSEIIETSIGQGKTLVTPLYMAMVTSAIANNGVMMNPYVVDHSETPWGGVRNRTIPSTFKRVVSTDTAYVIRDLMIEVVNSGTAAGRANFSVNGGSNSVSSDSAVSGGALEFTGPITVAAKTGTAENAGGEDHSWFVGFAPAENPQIAVAVIYENCGSGSNTIEAGRDIMKEYLSNLR